MNGAEVRSLRRTVGLRQVELAGALGVHRNIVWRWEKAEGEVIPRWAEALVKQWFVDGDWLEGMKRGRRKRRVGARVAKFEGGE